MAYVMTDELVPITCPKCRCKFGDSLWDLKRKSIVHCPDCGQSLNASAVVEENYRSMWRAMNHFRGEVLFRNAFLKESLTAREAPHGEVVAIDDKSPRVDPCSEGKPAARRNKRSVKAESRIKRGKS